MLAHASWALPTDSAHRVPTASVSAGAFAVLAQGDVWSPVTPDACWLTARRRFSRLTGGSRADGGSALHRPAEIRELTAQLALLLGLPRLEVEPAQPLEQIGAQLRVLELCRDDRAGMPARLGFCELGLLLLAGPATLERPDLGRAVARDRSELLGDVAVPLGLCPSLLCHAQVDQVDDGVEKDRDRGRVFLRRQAERRLHRLIR